MQRHPFEFRLYAVTVLLVLALQYLPHGHHDDLANSTNQSASFCTFSGGTAL